MFKRFLYLPLIYLLLLTFTCCNDEFDSPTFSEEGEWGVGIPVEFEVSISNAAGTRGVEDESKQYFEIDDLLHVSVVFNCKDKDNNDREFTEKKYCALTYKGSGKWEPIAGKRTLSWPAKAVSADFKAFYYHGSTGELTSQPMPPKLLGDYVLGEDPLQGETKQVEYGHSVKINMRHIFTHFTLTQITSGVSDNLYFSVPYKNPEFNGNNPGDAYYTEDYLNFNNAFQLILNPETKEITPVFVRVPSTTYKDKAGNGMVFVQGKTQLYEDEDGEMRSKVGYFLEPKAYHQFDLLYPRSREEIATYLNYNRNLSQLTGPEGLLASNYYEFSILKSLGVYVDETPEDGWDDSDPIIIVDVEKFLKSVNSGDPYTQPDPETGEEIEILESTVDGTRLLKNIDFNHYYYDVFEEGNFLPDLSQTFDGDYHYILNMACPLFNENHGVIKNLGIEDAVTNSNKPIPSNENFIPQWGGNAIDISKNGIICRSNFGNVTNLRVNHVEMTVEVKTTGSNFEESSQEAHSAAILFGLNRGNVYDLRLGGELKIIVRNEASTTIMPTVTIGGIAGQNLGTLSGIGPIDDEEFESPTYKIVNQCRGETGVYIVGGIAGNNMGNIYTATMAALTIDGSASSGVESIMGGITGMISLSNSGAPEIDGCIVRGEITAGPSRSVTNLNSNSYTGGVAGSMNVQGIVVNSSASIGVNGTKEYDALVTYAVGGAFGRIEKTLGSSEGYVNTLACFGSTLDGLVNIGNFAGLAPQGYSWEEKYENNNINIKQYDRYQNIGNFR